MRNRRQSLVPCERATRSAALAREMATTELFRRYRHIAFYLPNDGEVDLSPLISRAMAVGKRCFLPVLSPIFHNRLWFAPYDNDTWLTLNRFGIPEPAINWSSMRHPWSLDLILAPLVAFDERGNRLGMGGGFYDRTLAYLRHRKHWRKPLLIGVAYDFQQVHSLPAEPWDVPLDGILTEAGLRLFGARGD